MKRSLKPASATDFAFCESLSRCNMASYRSARGIAWDPQRYLAGWDRFETFVISADDRPVGVLQLFMLDGALEIRELQLLPSHQGRGIGAWAVARAQSEAASRGIGTLRLRVYEENPALRLYARLGFEVEGIDEGTIHMAYAVPPTYPKDAT